MSMTPTSATSSIVTALGGGSGIDMVGLAENLAVAQFAGRADRLTEQSERVERQISAAAQLKSLITTLASSVGDRVRTGDLSSQPLIANGAVAAVSRGTLSGKGTYSLEVTALAAAQTLSSPPLAAATAPVGAGSLTLRFGTLAAGVFTPDAAHAPATVTIASGATLADAAAAINAANAGVTAYVATAADGAHLVLKGQEGAANAFIVEAAEDPAEPGLAQLAWNGAPTANRLMGTAASAAYRLDGLAMTSPTNAIADAAPGLSLNLTGTNPGAPTTIRFADPTAAVSTFMADLTAALNELVTQLNTDADPVSGDLGSDPGTRALRRSLSQLSGAVVMPGAPAGAPATLADLGLAINRDGTFRLDGARLSATLKAAPADVAAMFTTGLFGVYGTLDKLARSATRAGDPGTIGGSIARFTTQKARLAGEQAKLVESQERLRAQLVQRFAATDTRVGASRSTLAFLKNQIDAWNAQGD